MSVGRGSREGLATTCIFKTTAKKVVFLVSKEKEQMVVFILLPIFWRQLMGWSSCAASQRFCLMALRNSNKKVT